MKKLLKNETMIILTFLLVSNVDLMTHGSVKAARPFTILVYTDELASESAGKRPPVVALKNFGYAFTQAGNHFEFQDFLKNKKWDLVLYNEEVYDPPESLFDDLNNYINGGGRAIITSWTVPSFSSKAIWSTIGVAYSKKLSFQGTRDIYLWEPQHQVFNTPNKIPSPLKLVDKEGFGVDGIIVKVLSISRAIAGNVPMAIEDEALIVVRNDGVVIFNGILTGLLNMDTDHDNKTEGVELWENEIQFLLAGEDTAPPKAEAGKDIVVDEGETVKFDGSGSTDDIAISDYTWSFTDGTSRILKGVNPTYVFNEPGVYAIKITVRDWVGKEDTDTVTVTVRDIAKPIANAGGDKTAEEGDTITLTGIQSTDNVGITEWEWDLGDGSTDEGVNVSHVYFKLGIYNVTLNVRDAAGNEGKDHIKVIITESTKPTIDVTMVFIIVVAYGFCLLVIRFRARIISYIHTHL